MERLTLHDQPLPSPSNLHQQQMQHPQQSGPPTPGPPMVPQLPPQMFTTAASLLDLTDKKLMVQLRDGKKLIGVLRSWDQFGNLVLQNTILRHFCQGLYGDEPQGLQLIRGENILLMGEIDLDKEDDIPSTWSPANWEEVASLEKKEAEGRKESDSRTLKRLRDLGFEGEHAGETVF